MASCRKHVIYKVPTICVYHMCGVRLSCGAVLHTKPITAFTLRPNVLCLQGPECTGPLWDVMPSVHLLVVFFNAAWYTGAIPGIISVWYTCMKLSGFQALRSWCSFSHFDNPGHSGSSAEAAADNRPVEEPVVVVLAGIEQVVRLDLVVPAADCSPHISQSLYDH